MSDYEMDEETDLPTLPEGLYWEVSTHSIEFGRKGFYLYLRRRGKWKLSLFDKVLAFLYVGPVERGLSKRALASTAEEILLRRYLLPEDQRWMTDKELAKNALVRAYL